MHVVIAQGALMLVPVPRLLPDMSSPPARPDGDGPLTQSRAVACRSALRVFR